MASPGKPTEHPVPRLYLVTPQDPSGLEDLLGEALDAADIAAVLLRLSAGEERWEVAHIKAVAGAVQAVAADPDANPRQRSPPSSEARHASSAVRVGFPVREYS